MVELILVSCIWKLINDNVKIARSIIQYKRELYRASGVVDEFEVARS